MKAYDKRLADLTADLACELAPIIAEKVIERIGAAGFVLFLINSDGTIVRVGNLTPSTERAVIQDWLCSEPAEFVEQYAPVKVLVPS